MASNIKYGQFNGIEYSISIFEHPAMENPVYRLMIPERGSKIFIQRIDTNSYPEWYTVSKFGGIWESREFLGYTKKEAIESILR